MNKIAVLVSGGLDSFIAYHCAVREVGEDNVFAIHVDLGQPYAEKERQAIEKSNIKCINIECKIMGTVLPDLKEEDWIIPGRNLLLVCLASMKCSTVYLSSLGTEMCYESRSHDKSKRFYKEASDLLTYVMDFEYKSDIIIKTPFESMSKTMMVTYALAELNLTKSQLCSTSSCYDSSSRFCGKCVACFNRWAAMSNNDIHEPYENNPWEFKYSLDTFNSVKNAVINNDYSHYSRIRVKEILEAYKKVGMYHE